MHPDSITAAHRSRLAYVYIRQSSAHQVLHHQESQRRQRALVERAVALGWPRERVTVSDEDLGQSAARHQERAGFQAMVAEAALGHVGLILALEVSRLARGNRNWDPSARHLRGHRNPARR
jgi:DNA invertase Pin-like site-specific DNA recombinase